MRMWILSFVGAAALGLLGAAPSAAAVLTGVVVDASGKPLEYANVAVAALHTGAVADDQGRFTLDLPAGRYEVVVSQMGYQAVKRLVEIGEAPAELKVALVEEPVPINEVIPIVMTAMHFGGSRHWFACPSCRRRCRIIYGGARFRCRVCYGARYECSTSTRRIQSAISAGL